MEPKTCVANLLVPAAHTVLPVVVFFADLIQSMNSGSVTTSNLPQQHTLVSIAEIAEDTKLATMAGAQITASGLTTKAPDHTGWESDPDEDLSLEAFAETDGVESVNESDESDTDNDEDDTEKKQVAKSCYDLTTGDICDDAWVSSNFPGRQVESIDEYNRNVFSKNGDYAKVTINGRAGSFRGIVLADKVMVLTDPIMERKAISHLPLGKDKLTPHFASKVAQYLGGSDKPFSLSAVMVKVFGNTIKGELPPLMSYDLALEIKKTQKKKKKRKRDDNPEPKSKAAAITVAVGRLKPGKRAKTVGPVVAPEPTAVDGITEVATQTLPVAAVPVQICSPTSLEAALTAYQRATLLVRSAAPPNVQVIFEPIRLELDK